MRLSEAIRLGAMMGKQIYDNFYGDEGNPAAGTCALGGAYSAIGVRRYSDEETDIWPLRMAVKCPACARRNGRRLGNTITHLNDDHRWTREAIADWVAGIEPVEAVTGGSEAARAVTSDVLQAVHAEVESVGVK